MGSPVLFGKAEAEGIGKRLAGQVARVRKSLGRATAAAAEEHSAAHAAADGDAALSAGLPALLARIDERLQVALAAPHTEVYVGFVEIATPEEQQAEAETEDEQTGAGLPPPDWLRAEVGAGGWQLLQELDAGIGLLFDEPAGWPATRPADPPGRLGFLALARCLRYAGTWADGQVKLAKKDADRRVEDAERAAECARDDADTSREARLGMEEPVDEMRSALDCAKGREEGLHYALQRAYGCTCMQL